MKAFIFAGTLALAPLAGACPPSIAQCGLGSQEVTETVNGCPIKTCRKVSDGVVNEEAASGSSSGSPVACRAKFNQEHPDCAVSETLLWSDRTCAFECKPDGELCKPKGPPPEAGCQFSNLWSVTECQWTCADDPFCPSYFCQGKWVWCGDGLSTPTSSGKYFSCKPKENPDGKPANRAAYGLKIDQLAKELEAMRTHDRSCERALDCVAVPTGHKACGGPNVYLVTSKNNPKMGQLKAKAEEFTALIKFYQQEFEQGIGSTCDIEGVPLFACRDKTCISEEGGNLVPAE